MQKVAQSFVLLLYCLPNFLKFYSHPIAENSPNPATVSVKTKARIDLINSALITFLQKKRKSLAPSIRNAGLENVQDEKAKILLFSTKNV
jgi:hypothetical protein